MADKHPVKQIKVHKHLKAMHEINADLFDKILDTDGFAFHFNEICKLAEYGDVHINSTNIKL